MKKSRFRFGILNQDEAGLKMAVVCREDGISAATFYGWKQKFGGMIAFVLVRDRHTGINFILSLAKYDVEISNT